MPKKWYEMQERAAGVKRLIFTWYVYKFFGKKAVGFIAFLVTLGAFLCSKQIRNYSVKNLKVIHDFCCLNGQKSPCPNNINAFKNVLNYSLSLVDNMEIFAGKFDFKKIYFDSSEDEKIFYEDIKNRTGMFFVCSHTGNIQVMRMFFKNEDAKKRCDVNVLLSKEQCRIFNEFLKKVQNFSNIVMENTVSLFPVEDISIETSIELKDRLDKGEIAFMAGDRLSSGTSNLTFCDKLFGVDTDFPAGTFKLAQLMEKPVYFICALKEKHDRYRVYLKKFEAANGAESKKAALNRMQKEYAEFLQYTTTIDPLQFYHFYPLFGAE